MKKHGIIMYTKTHGIPPTIENKLAGKLWYRNILGKLKISSKEWSEFKSEEHYCS